MPFEVYKKERIDLTKYDLVFHNLNLPLSVKKKHVSDNKNKPALILDANNRGEYFEGILKVNGSDPDGYLLINPNSTNTDGETLKLKYKSLESLLIKKPHAR